MKLIHAKILLEVERMNVAIMFLQLLKEYCAFLQNKDNTRSVDFVLLFIGTKQFLGRTKDVLLKEKSTFLANYYEKTRPEKELIISTYRKIEKILVEYSQYRKRH